MPRRSKTYKPRNESAKLFADSMERLLAREFRHIPAVTGRLEALDLRCRAGVETLRKMLKGIGNPDLATLDAVALALKSSLAEMFSRTSSARTANDDRDERAAGGELQRR